MYFFLQIPHTLVNTIAISWKVAFIEVRAEEYPDKNSLEPHPWGDKWVTKLRCALKLLSETQRLQLYHFFPLLAYHCNAANITGGSCHRWEWIVVTGGSGLWSQVGVDRGQSS